MLLGAQKNRHIEMVLLSTHHTVLGSEIRKLVFNYTLLSRGLRFNKKFLENNGSNLIIECY